MTTAETIFETMENDGLIEAVEQPTNGFAALGLSEASLRAVTEMGYEEPTPIQAQTISKMLAGMDVIAQAQTGTGKTAAFALPIIERMEPIARVPQALVLAPTRELAVQVAEAFQSYGKYHRLSVIAVYGGQPIDRQLRALDRGVQVVVGTPGRLLDHIQRGSLNLSQVRTVVLDEADEMLDMGFIEDIEAILKETPTERQTALFSATMPGPIAALAQKYMREPQRVTVKTQQMTVASVEQVYYEIGQRDKFEVLGRILDFERPSSAIIFCRTKSDVDALGERLMGRGFPAETLHGDLSQMQRDRVMGRFRTNQVVLLVATDVAARGLDIEHVSHVINYDIPLDPEVYVHRIGRTGRAGRAGKAITLVMSRDKRLLKLIERMTKAKIDRKRVPTIADVTAKRRETFVQTLRGTLEGGEFQSYLPLAEELSGEFDPAQLAAAAFRLLLGEANDNAEDRLAALEPEDRPERVDRFGDRNGRGDRFGDRRGSYGDRGPRADRFGGDRGGFGGERRERGGFGGGRGGFGGGSDAEPGMTRVYLDVGREDGVRPGDIVGAIANEAGLPGRTIGAIQLFGRDSYVEVPSEKAERVLRALRNTTIRGMRIAPNMGRGERR